MKPFLGTASAIEWAINNSVRHEFCFTVSYRPDYMLAIPTRKGENWEVKLELPYTAPRAKVL